MKNISNKFLCVVFSLLSSCAYASSALYPLEGMNILLDPGHGGVDSGAVGYYGLKEADVNLRVARYLKMLLEADGAQVSLTRESDKTLSLNDRVKIANKINPDIFISIHHNASLAKRTETKAEIYYAARENGFSKVLGEEMISQLKKINFGKDYKNIPGGFHVLRNTETSALLTEGAYLSVPKTELKLMSGKTLTEQAQAYRLAIRKASKKFMKVNYMCSSTMEVNTPYINIVFTPDRPLKQVNVRLLPQNCFHGFKTRRIIPWGNTYMLYCVDPLSSGDYTLEALCQGVDGSVSAKKRIKLKVALPASDMYVLPVAPYIPKGFKGHFPIIVNLVDAEGRPNQTKLSVAHKQVVNNRMKLGESLVSDKTGTIVFEYELSGNEKDSVIVKVPSELIGKAKDIQIPILPVENKHFILGKLIDSENKNDNLQAMAGAEIEYDGNRITTGPDGYFFIETEKNSLTLKIKSPIGYENHEYKMDNINVPVILPRIALKPICKNLQNKCFGIIAKADYDGKADKFANNLANAGAKAIRLRLNTKSEVPEYAPIIRANEIEEIKYLISFKPTKSKEVELRHYHSSKNGKRLCESVAKAINCGVKAKIMAASEYELNHSQAVGMVVGIPEKIVGEKLDKLFEQIYQGLATEF